MGTDVILIVDDSKFIAQAYSRVPLGLGYRVLIACDDKTGLFAAESCNPSLILLDMLMPDMDGVDVLRRSRQTPSTTDIPIFQGWQLAACQKEWQEAHPRRGGRVL
jgi:CheY-like chemotaxis protein